MKKYFKHTVMILCSIVTILTLSSLAQDNKNNRWAWTITGKPSQPSGMPWAKFFWAGSEIGKKYYDKTAMLIPVRMEGSPYYFNFQFDLGADITMLYGKSAASVNKRHPEINLKKPVFTFGDFTAVFSEPFYPQDFGGKIKSFDTTASAEGALLGTIGVDMFKNKVLIIDYPNERFSICEAVPVAYETKMVDFNLDRHGRVILPMEMKGVSFKVMFDNGSSIFPLITSSEHISQFSTEEVVESMNVSTWGKQNTVVGRPIKGEFTLAGQNYSHVLIYDAPSDNSSNEEYDAITGNALFWDKVLVIDFKNKKLGLKTP